MTRHRWLMAVLVLVVLSVGNLAWAQDQRQYVVVYVEFTPAQIQHGERVLQELAAVARKSPGFVSFTVLDEIARANRFALFEAVGQPGGLRELHERTEDAGAPPGAPAALGGPAGSATRHAHSLSPCLRILRDRTPREEDRPC